jgi:hypothetical protein
MRPVISHGAHTLGCLHLPDRPVVGSVKAAIGIPVLNPNALCE